MSTAIEYGWGQGLESLLQALWLSLTWLGRFPSSSWIQESYVRGGTSEASADSLPQGHSQTPQEGPRGSQERLTSPHIGDMVQYMA